MTRPQYKEYDSASVVAARRAGSSSCHDWIVDVLRPPQDRVCGNRYDPDEYSSAPELVLEIGSADGLWHFVPGNCRKDGSSWVHGVRWPSGSFTLARSLPQQAQRKTGRARNPAPARSLVLYASLGCSFTAALPPAGACCGRRRRR